MSTPPRIASTASRCFVQWLQSVEALLTAPRLLIHARDEEDVGQRGHAELSIKRRHAPPEADAFASGADDHHRTSTAKARVLRERSVVRRCSRRASAAADTVEIGPMLVSEPKPIADRHPPQHGNLKSFAGPAKPADMSIIVRRGKLMI